MVRKLITAVVFAATSMAAQSAFAAPGSVVSQLDMAALTSSLQHSTSSWSDWTFRSLSEAENELNFGSASSQTFSSDASVKDVSAFTVSGKAQSKSSGGVGNAELQMISDFTLAPGAHVTFSVPYSITLSTGKATDQSQGALYFEVKNLASNSVVFSNGANFSSSDLITHTPGSIDSRANSLLVDFVNNTGATTSYSFFGRVNATLRADYIAAVPEAETYAMLLAGLGMLALVARRRQGQSLSGKTTR